MIQSLHIHGYKCFADQTIPFSPLTMLVGANAAGKSSVIQALLLLRQSHKLGELDGGKIALAGPLVNVGHVLDIFCQHATDETISFSLQDDAGQLHFSHTFDHSKTKEYQLTGEERPYNSGSNLFWYAFNYLNAERVGPRLLYPMTTDSHWDGDVGTHGEYAAFVLGRAGLTAAIPIPAMAAADPASGQVTSHTLRNQTRLWMQQILGRFEFEAKLIDEADQVQILMGSHTSEQLYRPTNIGFGLIYTLPIVVAALGATPGSLLIVENPEAHLHPASQSAIGRFLAQVAANGVQVVIETHSDHVLNGIRVAIRQGALPADNCTINFFAHNPTVGQPEIIHPRIYESGGISPWPEGFFDQFDRDLLELL